MFQEPGTVGQPVAQPWALPPNAIHLLRGNKATIYPALENGPARNEGSVP